MHLIDIIFWYHYWIRKPNAQFGATQYELSVENLTEVFILKSILHKFKVIFFEYKVVFAREQPLMLAYCPGLLGSSPGAIPGDRAKATQNKDKRTLQQYISSNPKNNHYFLCRIGKSLHL